MKFKIPPTRTRVEAHSPACANTAIQDGIRKRIAYYAKHPSLINERLAQLDREWDIERLLETNASSLVVLGSAMSFITGHRRWMLLPLTVGGFLLQHAVQGWCPPIEVLRRLHVRTAREIEQERFALKALRGDFAIKALNQKTEGGKKLDPDLKAATAVAAVK